MTVIVIFCHNEYIFIIEEEVLTFESIFTISERYERVKYIR